MSLAIFTFAFFQRALLAGALMGILAPLVGIFFVSRRQAFFADTLAHASLAGVAIGIVLGAQSVALAMGVAAIAALFMEWLRKHGDLTGDAALALVLSGSLAGSVLLLSITGAWNAQVLSYLFGSITTVSSQDIIWLALLTGGISGVLYLWRAYFFLAAADARLAKVQGIPIERYESIFMVL